MRLIDADALHLGKFVEPRTEWHQGWNDALDAATTQAPTIDAVPVVHGRWVAKPTMCRHPNARNYYCSECRYEPTETKEFCPLCGARMDGE